MTVANSVLRIGTRCVIVAGCPQNIGLVVRIIRRIGATRGYLDGYEIQTVSGRKFHQLWFGSRLGTGNSDFAFTERAKLRPLVDPENFVSEEAEMNELPAQPIEGQAKTEKRSIDAACFMIEH